MVVHRWMAHVRIARVVGGPIFGLYYIAGQPGLRPRVDLICSIFSSATLLSFCSAPVWIRLRLEREVLCGMRGRRYEDVAVTTFALFAPGTLSGRRQRSAKHDSSKYGPTHRHLMAPLLESLLILCRVEYTNSSTATAPATLPSPPCNGCSVTASELFLTYPSTVEVDTATIVQTVIPLVTVYPDGSNVTNYKTVTAQANTTGIYKPPTPTDPYAHLTWVHVGVTLTYPTTYVQFLGLRGGLFTPVITATATSCAVKNENLHIGTFDRASLIVEVPATVQLDPAHPTTIPVPPAVHSFLNAIPAVSSQFSGTKVEDCAWTKIPLIGAPLGITESPGPGGAPSSSIAPNQKVTVSVL